MRLAASALGLLFAATVCLAADPRFTSDKRLLRPQNYHRWVFVGASFAMSYKEEGPARQNFHNTYIHPAAFDDFERTGKFPEGTILVLETRTAGSQASINREGHFEDRLAGVSAAVKDSRRFKEGWAYFTFQPGAGSAEAFPNDRCFACHKQHADRDNVFVQFYPVLRQPPK